MGFDGYIVLAILTLFFVYLLPSLIRSAQVVAEARIEDRFSADLHIIATAGTQTTREDPQGRIFIHPPRTSEQTMSTPVARKLATADARRVAAVRAARADASRRRGAAAKRRLMLFGVLGVLTIAGWATTALTSLTWVVPALLTAVTIGVVELGRRAAAAGRRADATFARQLREAEKRSGQADAPAPVSTEEPADLTAVLAEYEASAESENSSLRVEVDPQKQEGATWTPVPVPPPAYTLKAEVRRKVAEPLEVAAAEEEAATESAPAPAPAPQEAPAAEEPATGSLNVQEILARRRAVG